MKKKTSNGTLTIYSGPMMAGKTTALIAELEEGIEDNRTVLVVKPTIDNRFSDEDIVSHDGISLKETTGHKVKRLGVNETLELTDLAGIDLLLIDEAQFFTELCAYYVTQYLQQGIDVVAVGLDMDSEGRPFGSMPHLLSIANNVYKLTGVCAVCSEEATHTFRKLGVSSSDQVLIGGGETYEPRCLEHWFEGQKEKYEFTRT
jgi:thymidine kinase